MRILLTLAALLGLSGLAAAADDKDALAKLQGNWSLVRHDVQGAPLAEEKIKQFGLDRMSIKGQMFMRGKQTGTLKVDASKSPMQLDMMVVAGAFQGKTLVCIYSIEGDTLTICQSLPAKTDRPSEFKSAQGSQTILSVYKKDK
jgi:uncharacterized protein (TIGR03067 family)